MKNLESAKQTIIHYLERNNNQVLLSELPYMKLALSIITKEELSITQVESIFNTAINELIKDDKIYFTDRKVFLL